MIVRTANYFLRTGVAHEEGVLHNINYLLHLNHDLAVDAIEPIVDVSTGGPRRYRASVRGFEDIRLFEVAGTWYGTATACEFNQRERREIALLEFDGPDIVRALPLRGPDPERHEKNWMPLVVDGVVQLVYSCGPTVVLGGAVADGALEVVVEQDGPAGTERLRGGSQGVPVPGGHLFVVHEVDRSQPKMRYLHRFLLLGDDLVVAGLSPAFTFTADRVEFCAGMALRGDELVLSFGISDAAAGLATLDLDEALALLEPAVTAIGDETDQIAV
jgi:hypothetical protein